MGQIKNRIAKRCLNPWYNFLLIFCVAALMLFVVFELEKNHIRINLLQYIKGDDSWDTVLISATGIETTSNVAVQFETCPIFFVVEESSGEYECFSNKPASYNVQDMRKFIKSERVEAVIAGTMDLDTYKTFNSAHVEVFTGVTGTVDEALKKYKRKQLVSISTDYYHKHNGPKLFQSGNIKSVKKAKL